MQINPVGRGERELPQSVSRAGGSGASEEANETAAQERAEQTAKSAQSGGVSKAPGNQILDVLA